MVRVKSVVVTLQVDCLDGEVSAEAEVEFNHVPTEEQLAPHIAKLEEFIVDIEEHANA